MAIFMIRDNGREIVFERQPERSYNNTTGKWTQKDPTAIPVKHKARGVLSSFRKDMINGTTVLSTDMQLIIDATYKPELSDVVYMDGKKIGDIIAPISEVNPGGTPLIYELQIRR